MAVISEFEEEKEQKPSSSSPPVLGADEEALYRVMEQRGPLAFLEAAVDLVRRRSNFFKDESAVSQVMAVVSAAKEKAATKEKAAAKEKAVAEEKVRRKEAEEQKRVKEAELKKEAADRAVPLKMDVDAPSKQLEEEHPAVESSGKSDGPRKLHIF